MLEWVKAGYKDKEISETVLCTTLKYVFTSGRYHVYECADEMYVVIFNDQSKLLDYVNENIHSLFAISLLQNTSNKYRYSVMWQGFPRTVFTLARASVLIQGTQDDPRELHILDSLPVIQ